MPNNFDFANKDFSLPEDYKAEKGVPGIKRQNNIITLPLDFKESTVKWRLKFRRRQ